ncbi:hypothetical protein DNU06_13640 [Putridiphycobacter roseus]|uniref:Secretion system C-terminal sorting domain-containing protein n=1 Tax=Putridiphycobacter roseus TaxID=2219161 RepID=A0A2W1N0A9_9FLAO|nr:T9SS type A sorting domain-containing protein [Putridiphycobacter roseus]PZE16351.1 hypothetical protein DNU06_13640 [Putridiphycobacter roseus]
MKKVYLSTALMFLAGFSFAQMQSLESLKHIEPQTENSNVRPISLANDRAEGDVIITDDFSNFANWNIPADANGNQWDLLTATPSSVTNYIGTMASSTAANGFAFFNGIDLLLNATTTPFGVQDALLEYVPTINCTGIPGVTLEFEQRHRAFNSDTTWLEVSGDGGTNWTAFALNAELASNSNTEQNTKTVNISNVAGNSANVKIRFRWTGGDDQATGAGYGWFVDDLKVFESWDYESALVTSKYRMGVSGTVFLGGLDYHMIPLSQTAPIEFSGEILSNGGMVQTGSNLSVDISGAGTFSSVSPSSDIAIGATDSFAVANAFTPTAIGTYNVVMMANQTNPDHDLTNNVFNTSFEVTDYIYARDNGVDNGSISNVSSNPNLELSIGNLMEVFADGKVGAMEIVVSDAATNVGQSIYGRIFKYDANITDYVEVAITDDYIITADDIQGAPIRLYVNDGPYNVSAGDDLLVLAAHYGGTDEVEFATAQQVADGSVRGITADNSQFTLTSPSAIMVRLAMTDFTGVDEAEVSTITVGQNVPNPFNTTAKVAYTLNENANVSLNVVDLTGKVVATYNQGSQNAGNHTINLNADNLSNGVYFYTFTAGEYSVTKRMVVSK